MAGTSRPHPPESFDILVVGASFAGLSFARAAARRGASVCVIDHKRSPAEWIHTTGLFVNELEHEWWPPENLIRPIQRARLHLPSGRYVEVHKSDYHFAATDTGAVLRSMVGEVRSEGVDIRFAHRFRPEATERLAEHIELHDLGLRCRFLIGADGARSRVARWAGLDQNSRFLKGLEYEVAGIEHTGNALHCVCDRRLAPGYIAWAFEGVDGITQLGLACHPDHPIRRQALWARFSNIFSLDQARIVGKRGGVIPIGGVLKRYANEDVLLIGDAAGMVSPLTAGGIHYAIRCGRIAGAATAEHLRNEGPPPADVLGRHLPRFALKQQLRRVYDLFPVDRVLDTLSLLGPLARPLANGIFFGRYSNRGRQA